MITPAKASQAKGNYSWYTEFQKLSGYHFEKRFMAGHFPVSCARSKKFWRFPPFFEEGQKKKLFFRFFFSFIRQVYE